MDNTENLTYEISPYRLSSEHCRYKNDLGLFKVISLIFKKLRLIAVCKRCQKYYLLTKSYFIKWLSLYLTWAFGERLFEREKGPQVKDLNNA